ncbi:hypothetical protein FC36_GL001175 [Ligilactobacillus equi DSM 15833 = JCM 10991]|nr:hypothetical protein FC36_GL001175 [Ligilactobacillus equi DSM 15833 = JCM 10991]
MQKEAMFYPFFFVIQKKKILLYVYKNQRDVNQVMQKITSNSNNEALKNSEDFLPVDTIVFDNFSAFIGELFNYEDTDLLVSSDVKKGEVQLNANINNAESFSYDQMLVNSAIQQIAKSLCQ